LKTTLLKYISILGLILFFIACSTKKNTFLSRNSHALSTEYNILYNGGKALDKGIVDLKTQYKDNFWEQLPIERMQVSKETTLPGQPAQTNENFKRAETKAIKAIQKHSMNIAGYEKNPQMDEAHLLLGKARYYDQRFVPALEAFNYILYKYPMSDKIYEAKIWREKTNIRMDNDALAVENLRKLLKEIKFKDQIYADANAILSQAFLNLGQKDSAIAKLKLAKVFTKQNEEKARYNFILGQLYEELGYKDSAFASYQTVIDMKRKASRQYVIQAHARQAQHYDYEKGDTVAFLYKYNHLLKDRENRPFLDVINHQMGLFYDKRHKPDLANNYYNVSLGRKSLDPYLIASNYRNIAYIYFNKAKYVTAGKYYDSTLVQLNNRTREYKVIKTKRENLDDVIKYEAIATRNDSIIKVFSMSDADKVSYYENYITKLKKDDEAKRLLKEKADKEAASQNSGQQEQNPNQNFGIKKAADKGRSSGKSIDISKEIVMDNRKTSIAPPTDDNISAASTQSNFYFYNPTTVSFGKKEFRKNWGDRTLKGNWRISTTKEELAGIDGPDAVEEVQTGKNKTEKSKVTDLKYNPDFYIKQLPIKQTAIDSIAKERNVAYYKLGIIYKEKFLEYQLAANRLEKLLENKPESRLVLPSMYNLYKIYQIIDANKALAMKDKITSQFPNSRYAQIINNPNSTDEAIVQTPEASYDAVYRVYKAGDYRAVLTDATKAIEQFTGEEIVPKFELLKANTIGKLKGLAEFNKALNFIAVNYPNEEEGKQAELLVKNDIPKLEALKFYAEAAKSWKILFKVAINDEKTNKILLAKLEKFVATKKLDKLTVSNDIYTMNENFIVIHGIISEAYTKGIKSILKDYKDYKITQTPIVITNYNYKVLQIKKNLEEYLATKSTEPIPVSLAIPVPIENLAPEKTNNSNRPPSRANPSIEDPDDNELPVQNSNLIEKDSPARVKPATPIEKK
jgi:tetratricopeptide (TPR) repeat protein